MKKGKVIYAVVTVLLCLGLTMACSQPEEDNTVTISFNTSTCQPGCGCSGNDPGPRVASITIPKGKSLDDQGRTLPTPVRANHNFSGLWYWGNEPFFTDTKLNSNITLTARWSWDNPNKGSITFDPANGDTTQSIPGEIGFTLPFFMDDPVYYGYNFLGWFDDQGTKYTAETVLTRVRITITAKWEKNETDFTWIFITFNTNGGIPATIDDVEVPIGGTLGPNFPADPTSNDPENEFVGWYDSLGKKYDKDTIISGAVTIVAKWLKFGLQEDGSYLIDHTRWLNIVNGDTLAFGGQYTARYYELSNIGGMDTLKNYKQLVIFYSLIPDNPAHTSGFTVTFGGNTAVIGGSEHGDIGYYNINQTGSSVLIISETHLDTFKSSTTHSRIMLKQNSTNNFSMKITEMRLVNVLPQVTVKYVVNVGTGTGADITMTAGQAISNGSPSIPSNPTRDDYFFNRWYDANTGVTVTGATIPGNIVVIPEWIKILDVTFMSEDATYQTRKITQGSSFSNNKITGNAFPAAPTYSDGDAGAVFLGWYEAGNPVEYVASTVIDKNTTLTAKWLTADQIATVTFDTDGGTAIAPKMIEKGTTLGVLIPTAVRPPAAGTGYYFEGWFVGETQYTGATVITEDVTLVAKWKVTDPLSITLEAGKENDTLLNMVGSWNAGAGSATNTTPFIHDGKQYWVVGANHEGANWAAKNTNCDQSLYDAVKAWHGTGYTRLGYSFPATPNVYTTYTHVTLEYEMIPIAGTAQAIQIRRDLQAAGGAGIADSYTPNQTLSADAGSKFSRPLAAFYTSAGSTVGGFGIVCQTTTNAMLLRVTKITFDHQ